jgi:hypothetical protein
MALNGGVDQLEGGLKGGFSTVSRDMYIPSHRHREVWRSYVTPRKRDIPQQCSGSRLDDAQGLSCLPPHYGQCRHIPLVPSLCPHTWQSQTVDGIVGMRHSFHFWSQFPSSPKSLLACAFRYFLGHGHGSASCMTRLHIADSTCLFRRSHQPRKGARRDSNWKPPRTQQHSDDDRPFLSGEKKRNPGKLSFRCRSDIAVFHAWPV